MNTSLKLFLVQTAMPAISRYGSFYVLADGYDGAVDRVNDYLETNNLGFKKERTIINVQAIANSKAAHLHESKILLGV